MMGLETRIKKAGDSWTWEEAVREVLGWEVSEERVQIIGS
jgi:hypothetical protein